MFKFTHLQKIFKITSAHKDKKSIYLFFFITLISLLEVLNIGLILPFFSILLDENIISNSAKFGEIFKLVLPTSWLDNSNTIIKSKIEILLIGGSILFLLYLLKFVLIVLIYASIEKFTQKIKIKVCNEYYKRYINLPYKEHLNLKTSDILNNMTRIYEIPNSLVTISNILLECIVFVFISIILFKINFVSTLMLFILLPSVSILIMKFNKSKLLVWSKDKHEFNTARIGNIQDFFRSVKDIKILGKYKNFFNQFNYNVSKHTELIKKERVLNYYPRYLMELLLVFSSLFIFYYMFKQSNNIVEILPQLGLFIIGGLRLMPSVNKIISGYNNLKNLNYLTEIFYNLRAKSNIQMEKNKNLNLSKVENFENLHLNNISYKYEKANSEIIANLSLGIKKNQTIGIIGNSGIGKSTLLDLISGLIKPSSGDIQINGQNINKFCNLNEVIGYVPQQVYLVNDSIENNIAVGIEKDKINKEKISKAIKLSNLENYIKKLSNGIDTIVGENGKLISGGERQRIGIARALYNNPEILLLDEATSSLNNEISEKIIDDLLKISTELSIVFVTHNIKHISRFEKIYILDKKLTSYVNK